jgi:hypothetical protein
LQEDIAFRIVAEFKTDIPHFWLIAIIYDDKGNRTSFLAAQMTAGFEPGTHEFVMTISGPNLRQGEYILTFELLPEFDYNWTGRGRFPYLCHWDRCVYLKVDEHYRGPIDFGRVYLPVSVNHRRVEDRTALAPVA